MPFDETAPLPPLDQAAARASAPPALEPSVLQTAAAAWRQDNLIGSALSSEAMRATLDGSFYDIDRDYDVFADLKGYEDHSEAFENVFNRQAANAVKADIDRETRDRQVLAASGWTGALISGGASLLDPTILIPGGALVKSGRAGADIGRSALNVGLAAGAATAVQEAGLQAMQQLRTPEESALSIGGSVILGGVLGGGVSAVLTGLEARRASAVLSAAERPGFDAETDALHRDLDDIARAPQSAGAAVMSFDSLDDLTIAGTAASKVAAATAQLNPLLRTLTSPAAAVRRIASQIMEVPIYLRKNLRGLGDAAAETSMHEYTRGAVVKALEAQEKAYRAARQSGPAITHREFRDAVGRAMRRGDRSDMPGVSEAAQAWRSIVIEPLKQRAIEAGMLPPDVAVTTAESYFSRMWNRAAIEANEFEFRSIARDWLSRSLDDAMKADTDRRSRRAASLSREQESLQVNILRREEAVRRRSEAGGVTTLDDIGEGELTAAARRLASGDRLTAPESLSQWLASQRGGIFDAAGELSAAFPDAAKIPGFLRGSARSRLNASGGERLESVIRRAWQEGFIRDAEGRAPSAPPSVRDFLDALADDLAGSRVVRTADMAAAKAAGDFDRVMRAAGRTGLDLTRPLTNPADALKGVADTVTRVLNDLDREHIGRLGSSLSDLERRGRYDFLDDADRAAYLDEIVDDIFANVTGRSVDGPMPTGLVVSKRGPLKERTFNIPDALVEKFIESDVELVARRYARIMSADIELTERFGSPDLKGPLESIRAEYGELRQAAEADTTLGEVERAKRLKRLNGRERADIRDLEAVRDMLRGQYRPEIQNTTWARILSAAGTFNYVRALGGVLVSSLTDAVRPAMVHGLTAYMHDGIAPMVRNMRAVKMSHEEARLAGAISERWLASRLATMAEITDPYAMNSPFERFLNNAATGFSRMTGLLHWNDFQKGIAATMTQNRVLQNAETAARSGFDALPAGEQAYMAFLGIGRDRAAALGKLFLAHGETLDGVRVANSQGWGDEPAAALLRRAYRAAVNKDVDSIIVAKGVGDVPLFMSTPVGRAILQFRSFALASNQRVLMRGLQEDKTRFIGGVVGMTTIGAFIYALKQMEAGREISDNPGTWVAEGLDRSGIFALAFEVNNALEKIGAPGFYAGSAAIFPNASQRPPASRFAARSKVGSFLGPSFEAATDTVGMVSLAFENSRRALAGEPPAISEGDIATVRRLTPYASLPYWRWLIDGLIVPELKEAVK